VKIIDACFSGSLLVKGDMSSPQHKQGFKNLIQISSCLDSQTSLTGNPLSLFTDKFRAAVLRKMEGVVYYTDVISALRDEFITNEFQTPFFVSQGTGREQFVDEARRFDELRATLNPVQAVDSHQAYEQVTAPTLTAQQIFAAYEARVVTREKMNTFVGWLFDDLTEKISMNTFTDYYDLEFTEHKYFEDYTSQAFIVRVLSREKRIDNFVTANISRKQRRLNPMALTATAMYRERLWTDDDDMIETYDLSLNCSMPRVQFRVMLTPKFIALQQIKLVVTCAPSLEACYVFEVVTQHKRNDFGEFDFEGREVVKSWDNFNWTEKTDNFVTQLSGRLAEIVSTHVENTILLLDEGESTKNVQ